MISRESLLGDEAQAFVFGEVGEVLEVECCPDRFR